MDERLQFVADYLSGEYTMRDLCCDYGVSRPTGYLWIERYRREGMAGLQERSRRPHTSPQATTARQVAAIVALRRCKLGWGPRKLLTRLRAVHPHAPWPAASTIGEVLKRAGLIAKPPRRRAAPHPGGDPWGRDTRE